ncbi:MobC family plasmid mobilization relaxosome protein [Streptomyces sp. P38-E01]|uniref:MobC family plasmid mobilization relaxosome protein n=1 Tax=Streptomyces tardus TaxID=2780544 RepID=A0A949JF69_9ACTN|nr:MobC family plasmid mobilization relaxosome protein [Streptomyces tardus]
MHDPQPELPTRQRKMTADSTRAARYAVGPSKGRPNGGASAPEVAEALGRQGAPEQEQHPPPVPVPLSRAADEAALRRVARRRARMPVQRRDRVDVRYSAGEKAAILAKARSLNIAAAHYVGAVVMTHLDGKLNVALPGQRTSIDDLIDELAALRRELAGIGNNANQIARKLNAGAALHAGDLAALAHAERIQQSVAASIRHLAHTANQAVRHESAS